MLMCLTFKFHFQVLLLFIILYKKLLSRLHFISSIQNTNKYILVYIYFHLQKFIYKFFISLFFTHIEARISSCCEQFKNCGMFYLIGLYVYNKID